MSTDTHFISDAEDEDEEPDLGPAQMSEGEVHPHDRDIRKFMDDMTSNPEEMEHNLNSKENQEKLFSKYQLMGQSERDGRTVLHCLIDELPRATNRLTKPLGLAIKAITTRYPSLLKMPANNNRITPLYSAIQYCATKNQHSVARVIVLACKKTNLVAAASTGNEETSPKKPVHPLTEALAAECISSSDNHSETPLHLAMRSRAAFASDLGLDTLRRLAFYAGETAVLSRDGKNLTPLHYAVTYEWSSEKQYHIIGRLLSTGESPDLIKKGEAVLDNYPKKDVESVYQYHLRTRAEFKDPPAPDPESESPPQQKDGPKDSNKHSLGDSKKDGPGDFKKDGLGDSKKDGPGDSKKDGPGDSKKSGPGNSKEGPGGQEVHEVKQGPGGSKETPITKQGAVDRGRGRDGGERPNQMPNAGGVRNPTPAGSRAVKMPAAASVKDKGPEMNQEERKRYRDEWSDKIQDLLKIQCLRTRGQEASTRFLYGKNPKDIQTWFDYSGVAKEVDKEIFKETFKNVVFDNVLKYLAFPPVRVLNWNKKGEEFPRTGGLGRSDMLFFFRWLKDKKVSRILKVIVDDSSEEPHSDDAIVEALKLFKIESLDWSKLDLDPDTIFRASPDLTQIVLRWSGNNAVLRAWSEPEGLRRLPSLQKVILLEDQTRVLESPERTKKNIENFKKRLKETCPQYVQAHLEKIKPVAPVTNMGPPPVPVQAAPLVRAVECVSGLNVYGPPRPDASLSASDPSSDRTSITLPPHRWLDSTDAFAEKIENIWNKSFKQKKPSGGNDTAPSANTSASLSSGLQTREDVIVALIDDGVDTMAEQLTGRILPGRTFGFDGDRNLPWYASESGHGTVMASMIARVCPMAKIYPIRLNTGAKLKSGAGAMIDVASAASAIRAAVDRGANIISMSWTIAWPQGSLSTIFCEALDYALENNVLMFCSSRDSGHESGTRIHYLPAGHKRDNVVKIGAAQPSGLPYEWAGPLGNLDFILPGVEVVQRNTCRSPSDVKYMEKETGSSVATALGAGLAALIIYCARINKMFGSGPSGARLRDEDIKKLQDAQFMVSTIQQFGLSKNKLVEVWSKLDDKNKKLVGVPLTKQQDIVAQLARDLISPSAT